LLAVIGDQFDVGDEICGVVLSIRDHDIISVWNKTASNKEIRYKIRDALKRILKLPTGTILEYKAHNVSLKDNSSFRNTEIFRC
jgi:translation initiation factor 4E